MIASLTGILKSKSPTEILVDVNGVGFAISVPLSTSSSLGPVESTVRILTHLHVREDAVQLYGFATEPERQLFRHLLSVSGIGPKTALGILSGMSTADLQNHIASGNTAALTAVPGVGKKTAERLIIELREKVGRADKAFQDAIASGDRDAEMRNEALLALTSLGYNRVAAEKAIRMALQGGRERATSVEDLIKKALKYSGS